MKKISGNKISQIDLRGQQWVMERSLSLYRFKQTSRRVAGLLLVLCVSILIFTVLLAPNHPGPYETKQAVKGQEMKDPALYREVDLLRRQFHALITGSIESKLRRIEGSLRRGTIQAADLETLQGLKDDLKVLKNYSFLDSSQPVAAQPLPVAQQAGRGSSHLINNEQVLTEIAYMKNLLYVSIASCGLLFIGIGGLWLRSSFRLKQIDSKLSDSRLLLEKPHTDRS